MYVYVYVCIHTHDTHDKSIFASCSPQPRHVEQVIEVPVPMMQEEVGKFAAKPASLLGDFHVTDVK